ncbi:MAG: copper amine oxidase N-terminal domain-containing protein [Clostridia bacterium]|nr:copper amine oxidase N-terminal domain-containing protein [Clostridia bacterium]
MKAKNFFTVAISAIMITSGISAGAVNIKSFSEELTVYLNGTNVYANSENKPFIMNDRTLVPLRPIFEAMGIAEENIKWNPDEKKATFSDGVTECTFVNDSETVTRTGVDGDIKTISLDVPATIYNGNFYIPLRAFCNLWDMVIDWDNATRSVYVTGDIVTAENANKTNTDDFSLANFIGEWKNIDGLYLAQYLDIMVKIISVDKENQTVDLQYKYTMDGVGVWSGGERGYQDIITIPYHEETVNVQTGDKTTLQSSKAFVTDVIEVTGSDKNVSSIISGETVLTRFKLAVIEYTNSLYYGTPGAKSYYNDNKCERVN